jgi:hypothetical protein
LHFLLKARIIASFILLEGVGRTYMQTVFPSAFFLDVAAFGCSNFHGAAGFYLTENAPRCVYYGGLCTAWPRLKSSFLPPYYFDIMRQQQYGRIILWLPFIGRAVTSSVLTLRCGGWDWVVAALTSAGGALGRRTLLKSLIQDRT